MQNDWISCRVVPHFDMKLILDCWSEGENAESVIDDPGLSTVMEALNALDGMHRTMMSLSWNPKCILLVGGPCNGGYLVNGTLNYEDFFSPRNANAEPIQLTCFIGGQDGVYRAEQFVPKLMAENAIAYFCKNRDFSPDIDWYSQNGRGPQLLRT